MSIKYIYLVLLFFFVDNILSCELKNCDNYNCYINCGNKEYRVSVMSYNTYTSKVYAKPSGFIP